MTEYIVYFLSHCTGTIAEHMGKSLILSMDIGKEMLGSLWQIENRLKVDDLCGCLANGGVKLRQTL